MEKNEIEKDSLSRIECKKKINTTKGITLIALVITIIVLLILAGVSLSGMFNDKGIFSRAEKAGNKYNETKAREVLEMVLAGVGQYEKHSNLKYNQEDFLNELIKNEIVGSEVRGDVAIIDGWAFLLDRSVPKIGEPLGRAEGLIFPTVRVSEAELATDYRTSSFTVTAIEATNGINKIEIWLNGEKIKDLDKTYSNVKEEIEQEFTVNKNGVYTVKIYGKLMASETVEVTGIVPAVEFTPNGNTDWKKEHQTKITVKTNETITNMKYLWTTSGTNPPNANDFNNAESCTNNSTITGGNDTMTGTYYLWVMLTIGTGENQKTNICGSEGFNFDNEGPTVKLESTPVSETSFTLTATASDDKSGIARYEFYIDGEKKEPTTVENGKATYTWNGTEMTEDIESYVLVYDNSGNRENKATSSRTLMYIWENWGEYIPPYYKEEQVDWSNSGLLLSDSDSAGLTIGARYEFDKETGTFTLYDFYSFPQTYDSRFKEGYSLIREDGETRLIRWHMTSQTSSVNGKAQYSRWKYRAKKFNEVKPSGTTVKEILRSSNLDEYPNSGAKEVDGKWYWYNYIGIN